MVRGEPIYFKADFNASTGYAWLVDSSECGDSVRVITHYVGPNDTSNEDEEDEEEKKRPDRGPIGADEGEQRPIRGQSGVALFEVTADGDNIECVI